MTETGWSAKSKICALWAFIAKSLLTPVLWHLHIQAQFELLNFFYEILNFFFFLEITVRQSCSEKNLTAWADLK